MCVGFHECGSLLFREKKRRAFAMDEALPAEPAPAAAPANPSDPAPVHLAPRPKRKLPQPLGQKAASNAASSAGAMPAVPKAAPKEAPASASAPRSGCGERASSAPWRLMRGSEVALAGSSSGAADNPYYVSAAGSASSDAVPVSMGVPASSSVLPPPKAPPALIMPPMPTTTGARVKAAAPYSVPPQLRCLVWSLLYVACFFFGTMFFLELGQH